MAWECVDSYTVKSDFNDSPFVEIENRIIKSTNLPNLYLGEKNSIAITFCTDRYYNGLDLAESTKRLLKISYMIGDVEFVDSVVNVFTNEENKIKFTWIPKEFVTSKIGKVAFSVKLVGVDAEGVSLIWSTSNNELNVFDVVNPYMLQNFNESTNIYILNPDGFVKDTNEYKYTINITNLSIENNIEIYSASSTKEEEIMLENAGLYHYDVENGRILLYFNGYKPTSNIKIKIVVV